MMVATTRRPVTWVAWIDLALKPSCGAVVTMPFDSTLWLTVAAQQWPSARWSWAVRR